MSSIQAVLFDFGKVLTNDPNPTAWARLRELSGLDEDTLQHRYWAARDDYDSGHLTGDQYWRGIAGDGISADTLADLKAGDVALWTDMNPHMLAWVSELHRAGFRTGILSNMPDAMAEGICAHFDWIGNFDHAVWSHAYKLRKPQREIYALAAEGLKTPPANILFIDDKEENIRAAEDFGMHGIVFTKFPAFQQSMRDRGWQALLEPNLLSR